MGGLTLSEEGIGGGLWGGLLGGGAWEEERKGESMVDIQNE